LAKIPENVIIILREIRKNPGFGVVIPKPEKSPINKMLYFS
jgi:hypothetical protein